MFLNNYLHGRYGNHYLITLMHIICSQYMAESGPAAKTRSLLQLVELKVWVGLLLCMGVVRFPAITDYLERLLETQSNVRNESEPVSAKSNDISMSRLQCPPPPRPRRKASMVAKKWSQCPRLRKSDFMSAIFRASIYPLMR